MRFHGIEIPEQFMRHSVGNWSKHFIKWLAEVELSTQYGREALNLHIDQFIHLRAMLLQQTRIIRCISRSEAFTELTSVLGIGITTGITFLLEIDDISRFASADQLASYVGLIPMCHSSGDKEGIGDITAILRCYIIEAAWIAIRKDPAMTMAYGEYRKRMNAQKAIVKIARRLINRIYFVLKRRQEYVPCIVE